MRKEKDIFIQLKAIYIYGYSNIVPGDLNFIDIVQNIKIHQIRYYTTLLATEMVIEAINNYLAGRLISHKQGKKGRYYSFMPLALKKIVADKFHRFSERIDG